MNVRKRSVSNRESGGRRTLRRRPGRPGGKLKPERVQEMLKSMPGWRLVMGGNALARTRRLGDPGAAARFAASVAEMAAAQGRPVTLGVTGGRVTLTLQRPSRKGIDMTLIELARQLG